MIAIETRYLGPTNKRGSRIKAFTESGHTLTVSYPHEAREGAEAHSVAALALARKLGWDGEYVAGATARGYVFVPMDSDRFTVPFVPCARCGEGAARLVHERRLPETFDHPFKEAA